MMVICSVSPRQSVRVAVIGKRAVINLVLLNGMSGMSRSRSHLIET